MRKMLLIFRNEIASTISKKSFWLSTFLFPALVLALTFGSQLLAGDMMDVTKQLLPDPASQPAVGYVDESGLVEELPPQVTEAMLVALPDEPSAQEAIRSGRIDRYVVIPADYLQGGTVRVVSERFRPLDPTALPTVLLYALNYNLLGRDADRARLTFNPLPQLVSTSLAEGGAGSGAGAADDNSLAYYVPYAALLIFYFVLIMSGTYMLQSMAKEKENRTAEVLLLSVRPRELMTGKILGLCAISLFQVALWLGGGLLALSAYGDSLAAAGTPVSIPSSFAAWAVGYFVFGFILYASVLGALGALAPGAREGNQFVMVAILPLLVPLFMSNALIRDPNGTLTTFLSLFPLTSPVSMPTRLAATPVPLLQLLGGLAALAVTAYLFVLLAGRLVRTDTLLTYKALGLRRIGAELKGAK